MNKYKAIFFDMDGTLLPMDLQVFFKYYFGGLCKKLSHHGLDAKSIIDALWAGTEDMVKNDGSRKNDVIFWEKFEKILGVKRELLDSECLDFYKNEFNEAKKSTKENPLAVVAVKLAHEKAEKVVLSTNPLFPLQALKTRMSWIGLTENDFDLITSYETDSFCKPNPEYYIDICRRLNIKPEECLLIGNDEKEDMFAGSKAGLDCYLVTDCLLPYKEEPWKGAKGSFAEMVEMLKSL